MEMKGEKHSLLFSFFQYNKREIMKFENKIPAVITIGGKDVNKIRINGEVVWEKKVEPVDADYLYIQNTYNGTNTISVKQTLKGSPDSSLYAKTLQYSKDKTTWSTITLSSTTYNINLNQGEKVYFRGNEGVFNHYVIRGTEQAYTKITANQTFNVGGNINTLLNYHNPNNLTLPQGVFNNLFGGNVNLVSAENLTLQPSSDGSLPVFAYLYMFRNCTSLVKPPVLIAKTLSNSSYYSLFDGCSKLDNLTVYTDDNSQTNCTYKWLNGVASSGTFNNYGDAVYTKDSASGIPVGWVEVKPNEPNYFYVENTHNGTNNIYVKTRAHYKNTEPIGEFATTLEYSKDKTNWTTINLNYDYDNVSSSLVTNLTLSLSVGEKVYFRNTSGYFGYVDENYGTHSHQFSSDENIKVGGNIKSLLDYRDMVGTTMKKGCFYEMFFEAKKLTDASELILPDTVADSCYLKLFSGCYSLTSIPSLPALTMAPNCYCEMLKNTAITTPPALPATKLAPYCYRNLFENCYSLTSSPELPATTMVEGCYQGLFNSCNKLTTAPVLHAKTLAKYSYRYMFNGCLRLNSVTSYADNISATDCTRWWLDSVASTGTFHNLGTATYEKDSIDGIPTGWTEVKS